MKNSRRRTLLRILQWVCGTAFVAFSIIAALFFFSDMAAESQYEGLRGEILDVSADGAEGRAAIDWDSLLSQNPETVAWLSVDNTSVDYPIVQPAADKASDWYLSHDFWGAWSYIGSLYLDRRSNADGQHMLVLGHHLGLSGMMFSSIYDSYDQAKFNQIGTAHWCTPAGSTTDFTPILSMSVDKTYQPIQQFAFKDTADLHSWIAALAGDATALSGDWEELATGASRVLTLVTCSSTLGGQRARTLLVFVA